MAKSIEAHEYYGVELDSIPTSVLVWIIETYGPLGAGRWFTKGKILYFYNKQDHAMFLWRWL